MTYTFIPDAASRVIFSSEGPQPQTLFTEGQVRVVAAGLKADQIIPSHLEGLAVYTFLKGSGWMIVNGEKLAVGPGSIVITHAGVRRGIEANEELIFIGVRISELRAKRIETRNN